MADKRPPKTIKEKKFVKEYIKNGGNATKAAKKVYDTTSYNSSANIGYQNLKKLDFPAILDRAGITDDFIAKTMKEGMEAIKPISAVNGKDAGEASMDFIDVPDWQARLKATELATKAKGHLKDKIEHSGEVKMVPILGGISNNDNPR